MRINTEFFFHDIRFKTFAIKMWPLEATKAAQTSILTPSNSIAQKEVYIYLQRWWCILEKYTFSHVRHESLCPIGSPKLYIRAIRGSPRGFTHSILSATLYYLIYRRIYVAKNTCKPQLRIHLLLILYTCYHEIHSVLRTFKALKVTKQIPES